MKSVRVILLILCGAVPMAVLLIWASPAAPRSAEVTAAAAQSSTSGDFASPDNRGLADNGNGNSQGNQGFSRARWRRFVDSGDWDAFMEFLKINSPNRYQMLSRNPSAPHMALMRRWQALQQLKEKQPKMYQYRLEQIQKEDDVIARLLDYRQAVSNGDPMAQGAAYEKIRDDVRDLVELNLQERQLQLDTISNLLTQARQDLQRRRADIEQTVTQRTGQLISRGGEVPLINATQQKPQSSPGAGN